MAIGIAGGNPQLQCGALAGQRGGGGGNRHRGGDSAGGAQDHRGQRDGTVGGDGEVVGLTVARHPVLHTSGTGTNAPEVGRNVGQHPSAIGLDLNVSVQDADGAVLIQGFRRINKR